MKNLILFLLLALPLLQSCGGHEHHEGTSPQVLLDNGNRWQANSETTQGIADMQAILAKYEGKTEALSDRKALREELETGFQNIFKQCTMTGEAHEQLHNFLLPMKGIFEKIDSGTAAESQAAIGQLEKHLADYQNYFQ
ncbi:MAG: hypothetical protein K9J37_18510 [Saprospiraceae bacterium]|nr:hypothetical protein [Saprospiraceae bacterium]MCF8251914.1 hypothetical protein [Saprospiraceae bacterium]MCF8281593.1 hypothetical protein [Bacteroidales bacterium]MCF8313570.1 hypothetical protein [Saprospiraceae bacterium]MCF8442298.1 hypothetical protein [Saprospiraceae bacterium]